jgi:predicted hexulose-6-phosphate isomerase
MPKYLTFEQMLACAKTCGFDRLEISIDETDERLARLDWSSKQMNDFVCAVSSSGITVDTMCLSGHRRFPLGSRDEVVRKRSLEIMDKAVRFAARTGIRIIQLAGYDVYYEESDDFTRGLFVENLKKCIEMASCHGVILAFETMETPFMDTVEKAMVYVKALSSPYLGIYPDIGNLKNASVIYGNDLCADIKSGAGHIFAAHLKETAPGIYRDMRFGEGHTEYKKSIEALWNCGVRMFTGEFWCLIEERYMDDLEHAANFLRQKIEFAKAALS